MTRPKWICFLLICSLTLMVATPLLAEYEYPDPSQAEEVDPDGLEGIRVDRDHQTELEGIDQGRSGASQKIRSILRTIRAIGL